MLLIQINRINELYFLDEYKKNKSYICTRKKSINSNNNNGSEGSEEF